MWKWFKKLFSGSTSVDESIPEVRSTIPKTVIKSSIDDAVLPETLPEIFFDDENSVNAPDSLSDVLPDLGVDSGSESEILNESVSPRRAEYSDDFMSDLNDYLNDDDEDFELPVLPTPKRLIEVREPTPDDECKYCSHLFTDHSSTRGVCAVCMIQSSDADDVCLKFALMND